jgi:hypothetical protein
VILRKSRKGGKAKDGAQHAQRNSSLGSWPSSKAGSAPIEATAKWPQPEESCTQPVVMAARQQETILSSVRRAKTQAADERGRSGAARKGISVPGPPGHLLTMRCCQNDRTLLSFVRAAILRAPVQRHEHLETFIWLSVTTFRGEKWTHQGRRALAVSLNVTANAPGPYTGRSGGPVPP